jgi:hypothetical protein
MKGLQARGRDQDSVWIVLGRSWRSLRAARRQLRPHVPGLRGERPRAVPDRRAGVMSNQCEPLKPSA